MLTGYLASQNNPLTKLTLCPKKGKVMSESQKVNSGPRSKTHETDNIDLANEIADEKKTWLPVEV